MEAPLEQYIYEYSIIEVIHTNGDEVQTPIAYYHSNAVPPEINTMFNPGEFTTDAYDPYMVVNVVLTPRKTDADGASDATHVTVYVEKAAKKTDV